MPIDLWIRERERATTLPNGLRTLLDERAGALYGYLWLPKAKNPTWNYRFASRERFEAKVAESSAAYDAHLKRKADDRAARTAGDPTLMDPGTVLHYSWGYDQTNCNYYQVVARSGLMVEIAAIGSEIVPGSENVMSEQRRPVKDAFILECRTCGLYEGAFQHSNCGAFTHAFDGYRPTQRKRIQFMNGGAYLRMDHGHATIVKVVTFGNAPPLVAESHYSSHYA